ncbi:DUF2812 domain-containing protein [Clostridium estertheticum]|uniref:DUF2812 domain-containing protein n=1 Tax=Clostridium estertheticum TaxID=238834 RepID=UPI0013E92F2C|nr:DUF2812 domain-containing protein [Clostridium estertheticum]MBZ9688825.1 DUF2812 domain-containing protein [Clostridium estertheticum]
MSKRVFRPFWSLDIIETENWLCEMSAKGYSLNKIEDITKVFVFEKGEMSRVHFSICRHKTGINVASQSLLTSGWYSVYTNGKWTILANENDESQIKIHPSRESLLSRSRIIKYSIGSLLTLWLMMSIMPMLLLTELLFNSHNVSSNVTYMPGAKLSIILILLVLILLVYIMIKLNKSDKKLHIENGADLNLSFTIPKDTIIDYKAERKLRKDGKAIKKIKLGWFYSPDKTEEWLENMEMKGYNLYRMSRSGSTFHFMNGEPRNVKYSLDFQITVNDSYFEIHKTNGWKMIFTSFSSFTKHTLWGKEYSDEKPALYSDNSHIIKHAKKQCMVYCMLFTPLIIMYLFIIGSNIKMYLEGFPIIWPTLIIFSVCIIEFGYFVIKSLGYYLRTRKRFT